MKNYINFRIDVAKKSSIRHNIRTHRSKASMNQNPDAQAPNLLLVNGQIVELTKELVSQKRIEFQTQYEEDRFVHDLLFQARRKRPLPKENHTYGEAVFTFSEQMKIDLGTVYTIEDLFKIASQAMEEICKVMGTKPVKNSLVFHLDEDLGHFHFLFLNFDNTGKSIIHQNRNGRRLSHLQDIAGEHFSKLGIKRGEKRYTENGEYPKVNYKTTRQYHIEQIQSLKNELRDIKAHLKRQKEFYQRNSDEYIQLNRKVKRLRVIERQTRESIQRLQQNSKSSRVELEHIIKIFEDYTGINHEQILNKECHIMNNQIDSTDLKHEQDK